MELGVMDEVWLRRPTHRVSKRRVGLMGFNWNMICLICAFSSVWQSTRLLIELSLGSSPTRRTKNITEYAL